MALNNKKLLLLATSGTALEYYDFVIFGLLINYLTKVFLPLNIQDNSYINFTVIFAVGYLARFIGGTLLGILGDYIGRKPILIFTMCGMGITTFIIGCLPSYQTIGTISIILFLSARFIK